MYNLTCITKDMQHENAFKSFKSKINEITLFLPNQPIKP